MSGVYAAKVVVLGAGVSGMNSAAIALGMQAEVLLLDRNIEKLRQADRIYQGHCQTVASNKYEVERACLDAGRGDARGGRRRICAGGSRVRRAGDRICRLRNRLRWIKPVHQRIPDHQQDERDDEDDDRFAVHWGEFSGCGCNPRRGSGASFPFANRQQANLAIGNLKFGVWNFSLARGRGQTRPTGGSGRFAAPPASFRAASRVAESLRGRIASRSA